MHSGYRWSIKKFARTSRGHRTVQIRAADLRRPRPAGRASRRATESYSSTADDFASAHGQTEWTIAFSRDGWSARTTSRTTLTCTATDFHVHAELDAYHGEQRVASRDWEYTIPRDCL